MDYCAIAASNFTPWPLLLDSMQMQMDAVKWTTGRTDGRTDILCGTTPLLFMLIFCELKNGRVETGEVGVGGSSGRSYSIGIIRWTLLRFVRVVIVYVGDT